MASKRNIDQNGQCSNSEHGALGAGLSLHCRDHIGRIRNNDPTLTQFRLWPLDAARLSDEGWKLLGRYITNNTHLAKLHLSGRGLGAHADSVMSILFNNLTASSSLKELDLAGNVFGLSGVHSMVPFLQHCSNLAVLSFNDNHIINTDRFQVILEALDGSSVEELKFHHCSITDITALATFNLPHLKVIYLSRNNINSVSPLESCTSLEKLFLWSNNIGNEGCRVIAKLLANNSSSLHYLDLDNNNINDDGAEIIANSLKHNTALKTLDLDRNDGIRVRGWGSFLKLLNDVSSIERTYKPNHTLESIRFCSKHGSFLTQALPESHCVEIGRQSQHQHGLLPSDFGSSGWLLC